MRPRRGTKPLVPDEAQEGVYFRSCNFCGGTRFSIFKQLDVPFPPEIYGDADLTYPDVGERLKLEYLECWLCGLIGINPLTVFADIDRRTFDGERNIVAWADLDYETFALAAPGFGGPPRTEFCKTGRRPYDLAVAAVLLRCRLLLPGVFLIGSDGDWEREWLTGAIPDLAGRTAGLGARRLLAGLFDDVPQDNPFGPSRNSGAPR